MPHLSTNEALLVRQLSNGEHIGNTVTFLATPLNAVLLVGSWPAVDIAIYSRRHLPSIRRYGTFKRRRRPRDLVLAYI